MTDHTYPGRILTVVIRDDSPFVHMQEPVRHRTVRIELTDAQIEQLRMRQTGTVMGVPMYEDVAQCFLEPDTQESEP